MTVSAAETTTSAAPDRIVDSLVLVVDDIEAARAEP
jgi:hypothetical protein